MSLSPFWCMQKKWMMSNSPCSGERWFLYCCFCNIDRRHRSDSTLRHAHRHTKQMSAALTKALPYKHQEGETPAIYRVRLFAQSARKAQQFWIRYLLPPSILSTSSATEAAAAAASFITHSSSAKSCMCFVFVWTLPRISVIDPLGVITESYWTVANTSWDKMPQMLTHCISPTLQETVAHIKLNKATGHPGRCMTYFSLFLFLSTPQTHTPTFLYFLPLFCLSASSLTPHLSLCLWSDGGHAIAQNCSNF